MRGSIRPSGSGAPALVARSAVALLLWVLATNELAAQTNVVGGTQSLVWPSNCATTVLFRNQTRIPMAGLWVAIANDGVTNPPEIATISVHDQFAGRTWDVDDNEDLDNGDGSEADEIDSTPLGTSAGWHRVQARGNADVLAAGELFTLRLCDSSAGSLAGRTIFLLPASQSPGQTGGDLGRRAERPMRVTELSTSDTVTISPVNAPLDSTKFSAGLQNKSIKLLKKVKITPPSGVTILAASASGGGVYDFPTRTIIWPTPIPASSTTQINVEVDGLVRALVSTFTFEATEFVFGSGGGPGPVLPLWGILLVILGLALGGYRRLARRQAARDD